MILLIQFQLGLDLVGKAAEPPFLVVSRETHGVSDGQQNQLISCWGIDCAKRGHEGQVGRIRLAGNDAFFVPLLVQIFNGVTRPQVRGSSVCIVFSQVVL